MNDVKPETALELPEPVARRGITEAKWRTLKNNLFPGAATESVLMVWDYCAARGLDPMKKPCHIVPMEVKDAKTNTYAWRDVVMPGIYEYRTTAHRTGEYLGHSEPEYGPEIEAFGVKAPEWCKMTIYRWNSHAKMRVEFPVQVFFSEVCATRKDKQTGAIVANSRWGRAPKQMTCKCTEAAGIREAFPEEIGGEQTAEEMDGQRSIQTPVEVIDIPAPVKTALDRIPEGMRDNIDRAFALLELTPAQRLVKASEFLGGEADPESGAQALLDWCKAESEKRTTDPPRRRRNAPDNGKKAKETLPQGPNVPVPEVVEPQAIVAPPPVPAPPVQDASELF